MENENTSDPVVEDASDADFDAGFKGDATETPATPPPVETPPVEAAPVPPPEPEPEYVQLTKQDHEKLLAAFSKIEEIGALSKKVDSALGHVGALKQMVQRAQGETPAGQAVQLDEADFAELREQYPEFASLTIKGMKDRKSVV